MTCRTARLLQAPPGPRHGPSKAACPARRTASSTREVGQLSGLLAQLGAPLVAPAPADRRRLEACAFLLATVGAAGARCRAVIKAGDCLRSPSPHEIYSRGTTSVSICDALVVCRPYLFATRIVVSPSRSRPMEPDLLAGGKFNKSHLRGLALLAASTNVISKMFDAPIAGALFCCCIPALSVTALELFPDCTVLLPARSKSVSSWIVWCARLAMLGTALEVFNLAQQPKSQEVLVALCVHTLNFVMGLLAIELVSFRWLGAWQALRGYFVSIGGSTLMGTALVIGLDGSEYPSPGGTSHSVGVPLGCAMAAWLFASLTTPEIRTWNRVRSLHLAPALGRRMQFLEPSPPPSPPLSPPPRALPPAGAASARPHDLHSLALSVARCEANMRSADADARSCKEPEGPAFSKYAERFAFWKNAQTAVYASASDDTICQSVSFSDVLSVSDISDNASAHACDDDDEPSWLSDAADAVAALSHGEPSRLSDAADAVLAQPPLGAPVQPSPPSSKETSDSLGHAGVEEAAVLLRCTANLMWLVDMWFIDHGTPHRPSLANEKLAVSGASNEATGAADATGLPASVVRALCLQRIPCLHAWIALGGSVHATDASGIQCLHYAVMAPFDAAVDLLLFHGAPVDTRVASGGGATPLILASTRANPTIMCRLLAAGADPNGTDAHGHTPLMVCSRLGHAEHVHALLEAGASLDCTDGEQRTALFYGVKHEHHATVTALKLHRLRAGLANSATPTTPSPTTSPREARQGPHRHHRLRPRQLRDAHEAQTPEVP